MDRRNHGSSVGVGGRPNKGGGALHREDDYVFLTDLPTIAYLLLRKYTPQGVFEVGTTPQGRPLKQACFHDPKGLVEQAALEFTTHECRDYYDALGRARTLLNQFRGKNR